MSREEIIKEAAADHWSCVCCGFDDPIADAKEESFIEGAEWADEHPKEGLVSLDKACEWLWNEIYERIDDSNIRESLYDDNYRADLVVAFREAMEE